MNTLTHEKRCAVIRCLVDGCSIRATTRITGVAKNTIQRLTRELGEAVLAYHDNVVRNVKSQRIQCDEIWCFCYAKDKNLPDEMRGQPGVGSMWTWTAIDADTKLMIGWKLGARDAAIRPLQGRNGVSPTETQGGAPRLRRRSLPWAIVCDAFSVEVAKRATMTDAHLCRTATRNPLAEDPRGDGARCEPLKLCECSRTGETPVLLAT
jgi:transposase